MVVDKTPLIDNTDRDEESPEGAVSDTVPDSARPYDDDDDDDDDEPVVVPPGTRLAALIVVMILTALSLLYSPAVAATFLVGFHGVFEWFSAVMFVVDPSQLHNGWRPDGAGRMPVYLSESAGICYAFWGTLLLCKLHDPTVLWINAAYCIVWVLYLGNRHWWRGCWSNHDDDDDDGSWATVPVLVKGVCGVASAVAAWQSVHQ